MPSEVQARARIMVVEDEAIVARDIALSLAGLGYEVSGTAASGAEAMELAAATHPSLAFMDIHIQGPVDGVETATQLGERFDIPVIFLTAFADVDTIVRATRAQPYGYIVKPPGDRELHTAVDVALSRHADDKAARLMSRVVRSASFGVVVIEASAGEPVLYCNPAFERVSGYSVEEFRGRGLWSLAPEGGAESSGARELREAARERRAARVRWRCAGKGGRMFDAIVSLCPILRSAGDVTHLLLCFDEAGALPQT